MLWNRFQRKKKAVQNDSVKRLNPEEKIKETDLSSTDCSRSSTQGRSPCNSFQISDISSEHLAVTRSTRPITSKPTIRNPSVHIPESSITSNPSEKVAAEPGPYHCSDEEQEITARSFEPEDFCSRSNSPKPRDKRHAKDSGISSPKHSFFGTAEFLQPENTDSRLSASSEARLLTPPPVRVLITYAREPGLRDHLSTISCIVEFLLNNGIAVTYDLFEQRERMKGIADWLDESIAESNYILVCISPSYRKVVYCESPDDMQKVSNERDLLHTKYIHKRIRNEFIKMGSKNYRFVPVMVSGGQEKHIPPWLTDTIKFNWPSDFEDIIYWLYNIPRHVRPPRGPVPQFTVKMYGQVVSSA